MVSDSAHAIHQSVENSDDDDQPYTDLTTANPNNETFEEWKVKQSDSNTKSETRDPCNCISNSVSNFRSELRSGLKSNMYVTGFGAFSEVSNFSVSGFATDVYSQVLLVSIHDIRYPITVYELHQVFDPYGFVERIDILQLDGLLQAIVQFDSCQNSIFAKNQLHERCIYDGCCQLDIQFYRYYMNHTEVNFHDNMNHTEVVNPPDSAPDPDPTIDEPANKTILCKQNSIKTQVVSAVVSEIESLETWKNKQIAFKNSIAEEISGIKTQISTIKTTLQLLMHRLDIMSLPPQLATHFTASQTSLQHTSHSIPNQLLPPTKTLATAFPPATMSSPQPPTFPLPQGSKAYITTTVSTPCTQPVNPTTTAKVLERSTTMLSPLANGCPLEKLTSSLAEMNLSPANKFAPIEVLGSTKEYAPQSILFPNPQWELSSYQGFEFGKVHDADRMFSIIYESNEYGMLDLLLEQSVKKTFVVKRFIFDPGGNHLGNDRYNNQWLLAMLAKIRNQGYNKPFRSIIIHAHSLNLGDKVNFQAGESCYDTNMLQTTNTGQIEGSMISKAKGSSSACGI